MPGIKINVPEVLFYAFPNISSFFGKTDGTNVINNDEDFSMYLLHVAHISTVSGGAFVMISAFVFPLLLHGKAGGSNEAYE